MNVRGLMKKETNRRLQLVEELYYAKELLTSEQLMELLDCSLPALITDVRFLNGENLPFKITKIKGLYTIDFDSYATIDVVYAYILRTSLEYQVINSLFFEKSRGIQPAADRLNCSFSNMQRYLISVKKEVTKWDITVTHRPLQMVGDEAAIRHLFYLFFKESRMEFADYEFSQRLLNSVDELIRNILEENQITNNMNVHFQLMHSFLIGLQRQKQGHNMHRLSRDSGLIIPDVKQLDSLVRLIKRETSLVFTNTRLKECLWPLFSHQLILSRKQQAIAHKKNRRLSSFYHTHYLLLEGVSDLLSTPLSQNEIVDAARLLGNELFCYYPEKHSIEILQETEKIMLHLIDKKYYREIKKLENVVSKFLDPLQQEEFVPLYISYLITTIDNLLQRLIDSDRPIKVLLLSDTSTTHERFWNSVFPDFIKGSVKYEHFETPFIMQEQLTELTQQYDLIVTNVTMKDLVPACPLIAINAFPTAKDFDRIQQFINQFDPLLSRKELYHELTPST
ncbi:helix-turn-helix domain-containing protein [Enterococcus raffinosus]|uniref:helix-turn-helix domain-containing protein n=1 Tax=Enterococcus raffinosus TaxID=71452 RepID=UPI001C123DE4|nr:helix-turn-helix domain-containing protein [Enterococcus raffinosus]MBU5360190.1 helix-turn-helix domain-containing protein [Enterococcus raffinosus]